MNAQQKNEQKKHWRPAPAFVVTTTAALLIVAVLTFNWFAVRRTRVNAYVEIAAPQFAQVSALPSVSALPPVALPDGEVARLALRVREVSALLLGLTATAANHQFQQRSLPDVERLLDALTRVAPLPPGLTRATGQGALVSAHAAIYLRYRPQPYGLEIVSLGRVPHDGPAVLARIDAGAQPGTWLFIARKVAAASIPAPFTPLEQVIATGWQSEPFREGASSAPALTALQTWAQHYAVTNP